MGRAQPRLLVVSLHEATMDLVGEWAEAGRLPVFRRMMAEGLSGRLFSRSPLLGPERWGNLVTGQDANHHGLTEFLQRDRRGGFGPIRFGSRFGLQAEPIWRLLSVRGVPCGVVNAPVAYPEDVPHGFVIQEMLDAFAWRRVADDGWRRRMSGPATLYDEIQTRFGPAQVSVHDFEKDELVPLLEAQIERQVRVLSHLLARREWRFCLTRVSQVADAQHYLWADMISPDPANPYRSAIERVYQAVDRGIGALLEAAGPDAIVMVVSDCGAGPLRAGVQLNTWLSKEGFLRWNAPSLSGAPSATAAPGNGGLKAMARRILPGPIYRGAARLKNLLRPPPEQLAGDGKVAWAGTKAFAVGVEAGISINLRGREPDGIVEPGAEYSALCDEIVARLHALVDPETGEPAVDTVLTASELYGPSVAARVPDLFVEWRRDEYLPAEIEAEPGAVFVPHRQHGKVLPTTGGHRPNGMLVAAGPGVPTGRRDQASVFDLVPTCLHLLGQPLSSGLRGQSLVA